MVAPDLQGRGLGRMLLERIEAHAPESATGFELFTGRPAPIETMRAAAGAPLSCGPP